MLLASCYVLLSRVSMVRGRYRGELYGDLYWDLYRFWPWLLLLGPLGRRI